MSHACTPILVGVTSPVLEILLPSKTAKFPFLTMDYSPWSSKNSIDRNRLKKFMQVGIDVTCMHTNFGGRDQKIQSIGIDSKNSCNYKLMSNACTPILVGVASPVLEILLFSNYCINFLINFL